ncbi:hypothetical protein TGARI_371580 [Toxoplasma gondii ARI]|uniref:Uncharacterized protein n=1 Tax=Toxoplasma gondii ARI TaxID=1074872 RepID=A0A139XMG5_TOXGO|nr:hypothetical protein TGARI_371580 [Toxoplasma gondii ARI]
MYACMYLCISTKVSTSAAISCVSGFDTVPWHKRLSKHRRVYLCVDICQHASGVCAECLERLARNTSFSIAYPGSPLLPKVTTDSAASAQKTLTWQLLAAVLASPLPPADIQTYLLLRSCTFLIMKDASARRISVPQTPGVSLTTRAESPEQKRTTLWKPRGAAVIKQPRNPCLPDAGTPFCVLPVVRERFSLPPGSAPLLRSSWSPSGLSTFRSPALPHRRCSSSLLRSTRLESLS